VTDIHDQESESLPLHVNLCAERFAAVHERLGNIETTLADINNNINTLKTTTLTTYLSWAGGIIAVLLAVCGWLLARAI
jgi:hypothetical protein